MNDITNLVFKNIVFHREKFFITAFLSGLILFAAAGSFVFTFYIKKLADKPLESLQTELVMQKEDTGQNPTNVKTAGVILPSNLGPFHKNDFESKISVLPNVNGVSTALVLWQFGVKDNRTIVALDVNDPKVGLRDIENFLMAGSRFFSTDESLEAILERHFAKLFGYKIGGSYPIGDKNYKIVGLVDFQSQSNLANAQVFIPYLTALQIIGSKEEITNQAFVSLKSADQLGLSKNELSNQFPGFSILSKDSLLKNLSGLNQLFYKFGLYFEIGMVVISSLLIIFIVRLRRMEYGYQSAILRFLGWPKNKILKWVAIDTSFFLFCSTVFALILSFLLYRQMPSIVKLGSLINYSVPL